MKENWSETELENLFSFVIGGDWGKDLSESDPEYKTAYCIRGSEIRDWTKDKGKTAVLRKIPISSLEKRKLQYGDILLEISGGGPDQPVGRTVFIDDDVLAFEKATPKVCTNFLRLLRLSDEVDKKFINYYLTYFYKTGEVVNYQGGSNNLRNLKFSEYSRILIPIAPLPEQKRIVAKLDNLFAHVDQLKARLQNIPTLLKQFRQAVLTQAVTGKLTEEWRNEKGEIDVGQIIDSLRIDRINKAKTESQKTSILEIYSKVESDNRFEIPSGWRLVALDKVCNSFSYGSSNKSDESGLIPVLRMGNIQNGKLDWSDLKYSSDKEEIKKYELKSGDVLFNRTNSPELVGKTAIYKGEQPAIYAGYLIKISVTQELDPDYLNYCLNTSQAKAWCWEVKSDGVSQSNINAQKLADFEIPFCQIDEQKEIVRRVESLFAVADRIEASYNKLQEKIDHLPQAILSKAFRGELLNNDIDIELKHYANEADVFIVAAQPELK